MLTLTKNKIYLNDEKEEEINWFKNIRSALKNYLKNSLLFSIQNTHTLSIVYSYNINDRR